VADLQLAEAVLVTSLFFDKGGTGVKDRDISLARTWQV